MIYIYFAPAEGKVYIQDTEREDLIRIGYMNQLPPGNNKVLVAGLLKHAGFENTKSIKIIKQL